jgi:GTPase SAR1 family protein
MTKTKRTPTKQKPIVQEQTFVFKVLVVGDSGCGKVCVFNS